MIFLNSKLEINRNADNQRAVNDGFMIVPVVMLVEGVHNGSGGPIMYSEKEIAKNADAWNGVPVTFQHPLDSEGNNVSAVSSDAAKSFIIGEIFDAAFTDNKLKAKAKISVEALKAFSDGAVLALENFEHFEVSTGLFMEEQEAEGEWAGKKYRSLARNLRPDHLAFLWDVKGACSWKDGCGVRNTSVKTNLLSDDDLNTRLRALIQPLAPFNGSVYLYLTYATRKYFIYEVSTPDRGYVFYKQKYTLGKNGIPTLSGEPVEVVEQRNFIQVKANKQTSQEDGEEGAEKMVDSIERKAKVDVFLANEVSPFSEDDRGWLESIDCDSFARLKAGFDLLSEKIQTNAATVITEEPPSVAPTVPIAPVVPVAVEPPTEEPQIKTLHEWLGEVPPDVSKMLKEGLVLRDTKKADLVGKVMANKANPFTNEELSDKDIPELEKLARLASPHYQGQAGHSTAGKREFKANERSPDGMGVPDVPLIQWEITK